MWKRKETITANLDRGDDNAWILWVASVSFLLLGMKDNKFKNCSDSSGVD